jgi:hypothetical protein
MTRGLAILVALAGLSSPACASSQPVTTAEAACAVATARVTGERHLPASHVAYCDPVGEADGRAGYYIMGLRAHCLEDLCGSTLIGWFAVERATGDVFEVDDVSEWTLGRRVADEP